MPPNDTKWLEIAPNGSKCVKQLNKNVKNVKMVCYFLKKKKPKKSKVPDLLFASYLLTFIRTK
jgi:hypothetical protein